MIRLLLIFTALYAAYRLFCAARMAAADPSAATLAPCAWWLVLLVVLLALFDEIGRHLERHPVRTNHLDRYLKGEQQ